MDVIHTSTRTKTSRGKGTLGGDVRTHARLPPTFIDAACRALLKLRGTDDHILPLYNKKICNVIGVISFSYWLFQKCREYRRRDGAR